MTLQMFKIVILIQVFRGSSVPQTLSRFETFGSVKMSASTRRASLWMTWLAMMRRFCEFRAPITLVTITTTIAIVRMRMDLSVEEKLQRLNQEDFWHSDMRDEHLIKFRYGRPQ